MKRSLLPIPLAALAVLGGWLALAQVDKPSMDQLRERAARLEEKARDLKAEGRHDDARRIMQEAAELSEQAARLEGPREPERLQVRAAELKKDHARLVAEIEELRANGKQDQANELKRKLVNVERELDALRNRQMRQPEGRGPEDRPRDRRDQPPERAELERRLQHVQVAIDNLHAAGMHEFANRLAQERENLERTMRERPGMPEPMPELRRLREEIQELRNAVANLNRQMERFGGPRDAEPRNRPDRPGQGNPPRPQSPEGESRRP